VRKAGPCADQGRIRTFCDGCRRVETSPQGGLEERSTCGHDPGRNDNEAGLDQQTVEHGNAVGNMSACE